MRHHTRYAAQREFSPRVAVEQLERVGGARVCGIMRTRSIGLAVASLCALAAAKSASPAGVIAQPLAPEQLRAQLLDASNLGHVSARVADDAACRFLMTDRFSRKAPVGVTVEQDEAGGISVTLQDPSHDGFRKLQGWLRTLTLPSGTEFHALFVTNPATRQQTGWAALWSSKRPCLALNTSAPIRLTTGRMG